MWTRDIQTPKTPKLLFQEPIPCKYQQNTENKFVHLRGKITSPSTAAKFAQDERIDGKIPLNKYVDSCGIASQA